jgi:hypothetical protein
MSKNIANVYLNMLIMTGQYEEDLLSGLVNLLLEDRTINYLQLLTITQCLCRCHSSSLPSREERTKQRAY